MQTREKMVTNYALLTASLILPLAGAACANSSVSCVAVGGQGKRGIACGHMSLPGCAKTSWPPGMQY